MPGAESILRGNNYLYHRVKMRQLRRPLNVYDNAYSVSPMFLTLQKL